MSSVYPVVYPFYFMVSSSVAFAMMIKVNQKNKPHHHRF